METVMRWLVVAVAAVLGGCVGEVEETGGGGPATERSPMVDVCELAHGYQAVCDAEGVSCPTECDGDTECTVTTPAGMAAVPAQRGTCRPVCLGPNWCTVE